MSLFGCDTWVAMPDATRDGSVILAKNSDRPPMEAQPLVQQPRLRHAPGTRLRCTYIDIPQVEETFAHIGSKIWWAFGYEHGLNEHGVAIGNEAVWSKAGYRTADGLLGMDLVRLGLERGRTAHEAMYVITALLAAHGQCGDGERPGEWGNAHYHNSFLLADPREAWLLETAGPYWLARRITNGVFSVSNIYTIETDWDEAHPDTVAHAVHMGWTRSASEFNFARDYGDYWHRDAKPPGAMQVRRNTTLHCLQCDAGRITPETMMDIARNHMEGTAMAPRWGAADSFWPTPCLHDSPANPYHTAAGMVAHLRTEEPVYWASFSNPCTSVFEPFNLQTRPVPAEYATGTSTFAADSPWWQANRIKMLASLHYTEAAPLIRDTFARLTPAAARTQLNHELPAFLRRRGTRHLYMDYLRTWAAKAGVPLID